MSNLPPRLRAATLYDGTGAPAQHDMVVSSTDGRITGVEGYDAQVHGSALPHYAVLTPGLIDIQINGANDVQFGETSDVDSLRQIAIGAAKAGTAFILPTFVTAHGRAYQNAIHAARTAIETGVEGILGVHLEGPFLSPARPGIHDRTAIRRMEAEDIAALTAPFPGPLLLTLAPEEAREGQIRELTAAGVTVFAGHSAATFDDMARAEAEGLSGATHLFNAMSQMQPREPGVAGSVLGSSSLYAGIIADGHHVHWNNVAMAIRLMGERLCLVTDAMCTLAGTLQGFDLHGEKIFLDGGRLANADGTLAGAHIALDACIRNVITRGLTDAAHAVRMATLNPARAIGMADQLGTIARGHRAVFTVFDAEWQATAILR